MRNRGRTYFDVVSPAEAGLPPVRFYAARHRHSDEAAWRTRLENGEIVRLPRRCEAPGSAGTDGEPLGPDAALRAGDRLAWRRPPWDEPDVPTDFAVVHADDWVIAVDKPSGLPTVPDGGFFENTLARLVARRFPGEDPVPVHRLGRGTSGLVLFARTKAARDPLFAQFRDATARASGALRKRYLARTVPLDGVRPGDVRTVDVPIGPVPHARLGSVHAASPAGRPARSVCAVREVRPDCILWDVELVTGRPHQIRIHLAALGCPLLGDPLFLPGGGVRDDVLPGACGYFLRAVEISFVHPGTGRPFVLRVPDFV